jgi:hypothetical protein
MSRQAARRKRRASRSSHVRPNIWHFNSARLWAISYEDHDPELRLQPLDYGSRLPIGKQDQKYGQRDTGRSPR